MGGKSFNAEDTEENAKFAKLCFEALCFREDTEFTDPFYGPHFKSYRIL